MKTPLTVETIIENQPLEKIWDFWTNPKHIVNWCFASDDWHAPRAINDLQAGGKFSTRMEAKDGSQGFDMEGVYTFVDPLKTIEYVFGDRKVRIEFVKLENGYKVMETFDPEDINTEELQRAGWKSILENFKTYVTA